VETTYIENICKKQIGEGRSVCSFFWWNYGWYGL